MIFRSQVARPRTGIDKDIDAAHIVGKELQHFDANKIQRKPLFDRDVLTHQANLEHLTDFVFTQMGFEEQINSPVVVTETLCNPNKSRALLTELMFECYEVPAVSHVNDALAAFYGNSTHKNAISDGLIIHSGHHSTAIIVVLDGQMRLESSRRLPVGGNNHHDLLQKSLTLKYPQHR